MPVLRQRGPCASQPRPLESCTLSCQGPGRAGWAEGATFSSKFRSSCAHSFFSPALGTELRAWECQVTFNTVWKKTHLIALPALESRAQGVSDVLGRTFWTVTRSHCAGLATTGDILGLGEGTCEVGPHFFRQLSSGNCDPPAQTVRPQRHRALALKEVSQIPEGCSRPKRPISTVSQSQKRGCCF
ncbi:uncharacterized protein LOC101833147 isoform X3 [Mesocricetus auratus]|uniref:Uncharacterized protein LOC101833147 isoform X3 n=1 Tax=Mesocricetus auratus TaxID=10036 RepID=A0ABM2XWM2_MESAU|nr:uncharacterized protein LOC101833147 isoform X3 [Mesocricetus auratus]